jgi:hypothetical protein
MKIIPIVTTKYLSDKSIEIIRSLLDTNISWLKNYTYPVVKLGKTQLNGTYPAVYMNNGTDETQDLRPDNSVKAYCFFEKTGSDIANQAGLFNTYDLSLILWYNLKAIYTKTYDYTDELINEIKTELLKLNCLNIRVDYNNPFLKYNLKEEDTQYFMYPFGAVKINFSIKGKNC